MTQRIVFMGTPEFAVPTLQVLAEHYEVVGVVTQPGRPSGRGRKLKPSPVQVMAERHDLPLMSPRTLRDPASQAALAAWRPDVIVVAAFGQILPPAVLEWPPAGCVNVHASLLPRWRGAAPIAAAILAGDQETGVTIMRMDEGLDTGPLLRQASLVIADDDTRQTLTEKLSQLGARLLAETLPDWLAGKIVPQSQDALLVTYAPQISKAQGLVDWQTKTLAIERKVRAFYPWPAAFTYWQGAPLKILEAAVAVDNSAAPQSALPGTVLALDTGPAVVTGDGLLRLVTVQPAGKRPMPAKAFTRGARGFVGARLPA